MDEQDAHGEDRERLEEAPLGTLQAPRDPGRLQVLVPRPDRVPVADLRLEGEGRCGQVNQSQQSGREENPQFEGHGRRPAVGGCEVGGAGMVRDLYSRGGVAIGSCGESGALLSGTHGIVVRVPFILEILQLPLLFEAASDHPESLSLVESTCPLVPSKSEQRQASCGVLLRPSQ